MTAAPAPTPASTGSSRPVVTRPTRRGAELFMIFFAVVLAVGVTGTITAATDKHLDGKPIMYGAVLLVMFGVAHFVVRIYARYADPLILPLAAALNGIGVAFIYRLDLAHTKSHWDYASHQLMWTAIGIVGFVAVLVLLRDHKTLSRYAYTLGFGGLGLLAIPALLPASMSTVNGSKLWIRAGAFSIQPGEFAKLALMVFFAAYLVAKRDVLSLASKRVMGVDLPRPRDLGPVLIAWLASVGVLVLEKDLGSSLLFFGMFVVMLYVATERTSWLLIGLALFIGGAFIAWTLFAHVQERVTIWLDPWKDYRGNGYQIAQAQFSLGSGGLLGSGPGSGRPQLLLGEANSDFITATIAEELGLFGLTAILLMYLLIVQRGLRTALTVRDPFGKLLAGGLAFTLGLQVFVIVGGVTRLIPLTGLTTPFLAQGGSSLVANWMLVAVLLRISDAARRPSPATMSPPPPLANQPTQVVSR
jgi:cell division protein FtsW (lipid II flippase)